MADTEKTKTSKRPSPRKSSRKSTTRTEQQQQGCEEEWVYPLDQIVGHDNMKSALRRYLVGGGGEFKSALIWSEGELGGLELAEAVGAEMGALVHKVDCPVLWGSEYVELFDAEVSQVEGWLEQGEIVLMIFNDFEYIAHTEDVNYYAPRTLFRFLTALKSEKYAGLYVIGLTTEIVAINTNVYRRFDLHLELEPYDENELQTLIKNHLVPNEVFLGKKDLSWLSGKMLGFDLLALRNVIKRAKQEAFYRQTAAIKAEEADRDAAGDNPAGEEETGTVGKTRRKKRTTIIRSDLENALKSSREMLPFVATAELISEMRFEDIISPASKKLKEIISLYYDSRDMVKRHNIKPLNGILLHGPPGTGKTSLAKAVAHHIKGAFFNVSMAEITSKWFGEFEKNISQIFSRARAIAKKRNYPSVLFFDELDSWSARTDSDVMNRAVSVLLTELDGLTSDNNVLAIAATNRHSKLEKSLIRPGRFDLQIEVKLPTTDERLRIFRKYLKGTPIKGEKLKRLSELIKGLSGAEIENIVALAKIEKILEMKSAGTLDDNTGGKGTRKPSRKVAEGKKGNRGKEAILKLTVDNLISVMVNEKNYYLKLNRNPSFRALNKKKYLKGKKAIKTKDVDSLYV